MARPATPALSPRATFLFSSAGEHRDLHSFPTRRSSDLAGPPREGRAAFVRARRTPRGARRRVLGLARHGGLPARSDRKSTRLNSSHTVISYAVFCLKKKTSDETYRDGRGSAAGKGRAPA